MQVSVHLCASHVQYLVMPVFKCAHAQVCVICVSLLRCARAYVILHRRGCNRTVCTASAVIPGQRGRPVWAERRSNPLRLFRASMRSFSTISPRRPGPLTAPVSPPSEGAHSHVEDRRWIMRTPRRVGYGKKCARRAQGRAELITACRLLQQDGIEVHWTIWRYYGRVLDNMAVYLASLLQDVVAVHRYCATRCTVHALSMMVG